MQSTLLSIPIDGYRPILPVSYVREIPLKFDIYILVSRHSERRYLILTVVPYEFGLECTDFGHMVQAIVINLALVGDDSVVPGVRCEVHGLVLLCP